MTTALKDSRLAVAEAYGEFTRIERKIESIDSAQVVELKQSVVPNSEMFHCSGTYAGGKFQLPEKLAFKLKNGVFFSRVQIGREVTDPKPPSSFRYFGLGLISLEGARIIRRALNLAFDPKRDFIGEITEAEAQHGFLLTPFIHARIQAIQGIESKNNAFLDLFKFVLTFHHETPDIEVLADAAALNRAVTGFYPPHHPPTIPPVAFQEVEHSADGAPARLAALVRVAQTRIARCEMRTELSRFEVLDRGLLGKQS